MKILRIKGTSAEAELRGRALLAGVRSRSETPAAGPERTGGHGSDAGTQGCRGDAKGGDRPTSRAPHLKESQASPSPEARHLRERKSNQEPAWPIPGPHPGTSVHGTARLRTALQLPLGRRGALLPGQALRAFSNTLAPTLGGRKEALPFPRPCVAAASMQDTHFQPPGRAGRDRGRQRAQHPACASCSATSQRLAAGLQPREAPNRSPVALRPPSGAGTQGCAVPSE